MKKAVIITVAVAILGILGVYNNEQPASGAGSSYLSGSSNTQMVSSNTGNSLPVSYKDGNYTGGAADTPYGTVQVLAVINAGKITDIKFLQMPSDEGHSREVTSFSEGPLKQSAIAKQSANVDFVSGATSTVYGFQESLQAALDQAARA